MAQFVLQRAMHASVVLVVVSLLVFCGIYAIGNPVHVLIDPRSSQEVIDQAIRNLGLDRPLWEQYLLFLRNAMEGDLGNSYVHSRPALQVILERLPATLELIFVAMSIAVVAGIPLGLIAGSMGERLPGRALSNLSVLGFSLPTFWVGLTLILIFSIELRWLPSGGRGEVGALLGVRTSLATSDGWKHVLLPAVNLSLFPMALLMRLVRSGVIEQANMDYVRFARAKGLSSTRILIAYIFRNTLIPVVTVMGLVTGGLIAFSVVTESVFAWPGIGKLIVDSIRLLDRPVIVAYILIVVLVFTAINFATDVTYSIIDPRIRLGGANR
ncbi:MAG TPA: ABC transporter permease [Rhizobiaceae bacterium]|nr:ABC transporter permease [Rhizobiaceae bacterium]